ncbi:MAG: NADH-quinone oxidoreductase subunit L [Planctomycetota bacterium]
MSTWNALWLVPLLPLLGSAAAGAIHFLCLRARQKSPEATGPAQLAAAVAIGAAVSAFAVSLVAFFKLAGGGEELTSLESSAWSWIHVGSLQVDVALVADRLSAVMLLVVTGVGSLIHVYSAGYMKGDPGFAKFFAYLNLFLFAMLMLVLSSNLLGLFVGWEGVGLCSYLLIGFWYEKGWPAEAGQKAFVVNRIGDASFLIGSFLLFQVFGTLDLSDIGAAVPALLDEHSGKLTLAALLLFGGACGKSAQLPLFTWLPDAMAGPTPVSALIHAATMVTAGIYMIVRLNPLFAAAPEVLTLIGCVGAATAFIGGSTALAQHDIKKVLAYSTVSQLGYMFLGLSAGAFGAAVFHLVTHAFFKALLFLGAGSVIHGMHEEQDMRNMGGLRAHMPRTFVTFVAGAAALSGLPLLSGFFSKDEILAFTFATGGLHYALWLVGVATAAMTAFYTWRMVSLTFFGRERFDAAEVHPHESPISMTLPLMVLAVLSVIGGVLGLPPVLHLPHLLSDWLAPVTQPGAELLAASRGDVHPSHAVEWILLGLGAFLALAFAHQGFWRYTRGPAADDQLFGSRPKVAGFLGDAWTIDRTYTSVIVRPIQLLAFLVAVFVDQLGIDGMVNGAAKLARESASKLRVMVDGSVKSYALWMGAGAACLAVFWIFGGTA